jgi:hypothetical protein
VKRNLSKKNHLLFFLKIARILYGSWGKFYELYENDAEIANKLLYLNYTYGWRDPNSKKMLCV